jgi:ATP-dependent Lhr-like helicase
LGGRRWSVKHVDWDRRQAFVEPTEQRGRSRWLGTGKLLSFTLCQAIKSVLTEEGLTPHLSKRGTARLEELREDFAWVNEGETSLVTDQFASRWWTFAGSLVNACFGNAFIETGYRIRFDDFAVRIEPANGAANLIRKISKSVRERPVLLATQAVEQMADRIKFVDCVPPLLRYAMVSARQMRVDDCEQIANQPVTEVMRR